MAEVLRRLREPREVFVEQPPATVFQSQRFEQFDGPRRTPQERLLVAPFLRFRTPPANRR
jgi:hypothetical protein